MKGLVIALAIILASNWCYAQKDYFIISKDGVKLHVTEYGQGEPVILLAGGPGLNAAYLQPVWEPLSKNYRCIVLDERGTGKSFVEKIDSTSMSMENYINDLEALRISLHLDQLTLVGHSWGGMLSMVYLSQKPANVKKVLLLNPGGPSRKFLRYFNDNIFMRLTQEDLAEAQQADSLHVSSLKAIWPGYFYDHNRGVATKKLISGEVGESVSDLTNHNYFAYSNQMIAKLKEVKTPVFLIQGRQDPIGESTVWEIKEIMPQTQIHFIERCGHLPWWENEKQIKDFFNTVNADLSK